MSSSFVSAPVYAYTRYYCNVTDDYGNTQDIWFDLYVDNQFCAEPVGEQERYVTPGETVTMAVSAHFDLGEVHYQWYESVEVVDEESGNSWEEFLPIEGAVSSSFSISAVSATTTATTRTSGSRSISTIISLCSRSAHRIAPLPTSRA